MKLTLEERVANGTRLLDERMPDWFTEVDPVTLDIRDLRFCVLGQLYEDWRIGSKELAMDCLTLGDEESRRLQELHGFELTEDEYHEGHGAYAASRLEDCWVAAILIRMAA